MKECVACTNTGWLHAVSDERGREIQRCDDCQAYRTDLLAKKAHDKVCSRDCQWRFDIPTDARGVIERLGRMAPSINFKAIWTEDLSFCWDGDGPDPGLEGYVAHDVDVEARVIVGGRIISGSESLGGCYEKVGRRDPDVHGYFLQMASAALDDLATQLKGNTRLLKEVRKAWLFLKKASKASYDKQREEYADRK